MHKVKDKSLKTTILKYLKYFEVDIMDLLYQSDVKLLTEKIRKVYLK
jgi:hypothetical protein